MVKITLLDGPYAGQTRTGEQVEQDGTSPVDLLMAFASQNWRWRLDLRRATDEEEFLWLRADLVARCIRALRHGCTVTFKGRVYSGLKQGGALDDAIAGCGQYVRIVSDDASGVVLEAVGTAPSA